MIAGPVGGQGQEDGLFVQNKRREVLPSRMLPVGFLSPPLWTLLACCLSKQKGPEMIQDKHTATAAHPGAKTLLTCTHGYILPEESLGWRSLKLKEIISTLHLRQQVVRDGLRCRELMRKGKKEEFRRERCEVEEEAGDSSDGPVLTYGRALLV
ncbi:unnamed protein product [Pleuronectes platessa]|uniref:Uncharacterized protein n=1 Tax=Pleuronectes platessa TaxID=8262 RepID=A0A9N7VBJ8_PLEPL|nr:unnamed protein product [Pleuronectes platessa]